MRFDRMRRIMKEAIRNVNRIRFNRPRVLIGTARDPAKKAGHVGLRTERTPSKPYIYLAQ
jgi:hypothetical protein